MSSLSQPPPQPRVSRDPVHTPSELGTMFGIKRGKLSNLLNSEHCPTLHARRGPTGRIVEVRLTPELRAFLSAK